MAAAIKLPNEVVKNSICKETCAYPFKQKMYGAGKGLKQKTGSGYWSSSGWVNTQPEYAHGEIAPSFNSLTETQQKQKLQSLRNPFIHPGQTLGQRKAYAKNAGIRRQELNKRDARKSSEYRAARDRYSKKKQIISEKFDPLQ